MRVTQMSAFNRTEKPFSPSRTENPVYENAPKKDKGFLNFLESFGTDDYILAGIIIVLIMEGCEDYILLAALGYLFIMGFRD